MNFNDEVEDGRTEAGNTGVPEKLKENGEITWQEKVGLSLKTPIGLLGIGAPDHSMFYDDCPGFSGSYDRAHRKPLCSDCHNRPTHVYEGLEQEVDFVADNEATLLSSGAYLFESCLGNVWPKMNVTWGTYKGHNGHQNEEDGYGCFRCHDDEHQASFGKTIPQNCDLCHDEP